MITPLFAAVYDLSWSGPQDGVSQYKKADRNSHQHDDYKERHLPKRPLRPALNFGSRLMQIGSHDRFLLLDLIFSQAFVGVAGFYQQGSGLSAAVLAAMFVERQAREVALFPRSGRRLTDRIEYRFILDPLKQSLDRDAELMRRLGVSLCQQ